LPDSVGVCTRCEIDRPRWMCSAANCWRPELFVGYYNIFRYTANCHNCFREVTTE
jgi:hypothetical protein